MPPKMTKASKARKLLTSKFQKGEITGKENPKTVYESEPVFQQHKLAIFRTHFNNLKKEYSSDDVDEDSADAEDLDRRRRDQDFKKRRVIPREVDLDDDELHEAGAGVELISRDMSFKPLYLLSIWEEPGIKTKRITAAVVLPSGVESGDFSVSVDGGGEFLELSVIWPGPIMDLHWLHTKWLRQDANDGYTEYHPKILGFENALKMKRVRASDDLKSTARIPLPFPVQTHIDAKYNLGWKGSAAKIVYVDLKASAENYAVVNDCQEFEMY